MYKKKYLKYKKKYFDLIEQSDGNGLHNFLIKYGGASMSATTESAAGKKVLLIGDSLFSGFDSGSIKHRESFKEKLIKTLNR